MDYLPVLKIRFDDKANGKEIEDLTLETAEFIALKSYRARGKRLSKNVIKSVEFQAPLPYEAPAEEEDVKDEPALEAGQGEIKSKKEGDNVSKVDTAKSKLEDEDKQIRLDL